MCQVQIGLPVSDCHQLLSTTNGWQKVKTGGQVCRPKAGLNPLPVWPNDWSQCFFFPEVFKVSMLQLLILGLWCICHSLKTAYMTGVRVTSAEAVTQDWCMFRLSWRCAVYQMHAVPFLQGRRLISSDSILPSDISQQASSSFFLLLLICQKRYSSEVEGARAENIGSQRCN